MKRNIHNRGRQGQGAFTLIEMMVVVAIVAILAGLLLSALPAMQTKKAKMAAQAQLKNLETLILAYHAKYNSYPLDNPNISAPDHTARHPLYYELVGSTYTNNGVIGWYETAAESITETNLINYFGQPGLRNVTLDRGNPESPKSVNFFGSLNTDAYTSLDTGGGPDIKLLRFAVKDDRNMLTNANGVLFNPWRYVSTAPTNNQGRFDLWVEFEVGGSRFRVSNWENGPVTLERPVR